MEPGFLYRVDNPELINIFKDYFYSDPDKINPNRGHQNYEKNVGTIKEFWENRWDSRATFMEDNRDIYDYLNKITYPHDPEYNIIQSWMKYYPQDSFSALHTEINNTEVVSRKEQYSNVILIDQDPDIEGGVIVIAGDSMDINFSHPNADGNLRQRLLTRKLVNPGDAIVWDERAVHGVSKVEKGHRLTLVCIKAKWEKKYG